MQKLFALTDTAGQVIPGTVSISQSRVLEIFAKSTTWIDVTDRPECQAEVAPPAHMSTVGGIASRNTYPRQASSHGQLGFGGSFRAKGH